MFPKIRGAVFGVPIIRTIAFWGLYWGPPILGNYKIIPVVALQVFILCPANFEETRSHKRFKVAGRLTCKNSGIE